MYEISIRTHFSAAHRLVGHQGVCARIHGHNWEIEIFLKGPVLDEIGILVDFKVVKEAVQEVLGALDHADLNQHPGFAVQNPTSENIARLLFEDLGRRLNTDRCRISKVRVSESPNSSATYWEE
jgi:6-pyruvoyltetrahydropterin/6-carboxytetrahydropterin synthase